MEKRSDSVNNVGFAQKPGLWFLRNVFPMLSSVAPFIAVRLALSLFLTPQRHKIPKWEIPYFNSAEKSWLNISGKNCAAYSWGEGKRVIVLCHSWGGRATQLAAFIPSLISQGFKVVGFDAPAHGNSSGKRTDMMEYTSGINEIIKQYGPIYGILGHSFGAANALIAKRRFDFKVNKIALVGCFTDGIWITDIFGEILNIPASITHAMRALLEKRYKGELDWNKLKIAPIVRDFKGDILFIHDRDDKEIPYLHAEQLINDSGVPSDLLMSTNGLGHRRILRNEMVINRVSGFFCK